MKRLVFPLVFAAFVFVSKRENCARGDRSLNDARSEKEFYHECFSRVRGGRYFHSEISERETYC